MRRITGLILMIALVLSLIPMSVLAEDATNNDPLWDVEKGKWYYKDVHEVYARGMIQGKDEYGVKSFKPNDPVSQYEALAMVLRYLDKETVVKSLTDDEIEKRFGLLGIEVSSVPAWARAYVAAGITFGYVKTKNDALDIKASRAWISQLLVRVVEKESQALSAEMMANTSFADDSAIPYAQKGYINTVVSLGLMKGVSENGVLTFNPSGVTSRAEMATILKRLDEHRNVPSNYSKTVVIKELTETGIEFQNEDGRYETLHMNNPTVFLYGQKAALRDLNKYDLARIAVRNNEIVFIDVTGKGELKQNVVIGTFEKIDQELKLIWVVQNGENIDPLRYTDPLMIKNEQGTALELTELKKGKEVMVYVQDDQQTISEIVITGTSPAQNSTPTEKVIGTFLTLDEEKLWITIELDNGTVKTFTYSVNSYVVHEQVRFPKVSDLKKGDRIELSVTGSVVGEIKVLDLAKEATNVSGMIVSVNEKLATITVRSDEQVLAYTISPLVVITMEGVVNPKLSMLKEGYNVKLDIVDRKVTKIEVIGDAYSKEMKGRFIGVDTKTGIINFRAENGELMAKELSDKVYVEMEGVSRSLLDLQEKMRIILTLKDDKVTEIVLDNKRQGTIKSINTTSRKVVVTQDGQDLEYSILAVLPIDLYGVASPKLTDLKVGMDIQFYLNVDDEIKSVVVSQSQDYTVLSIDTEKKTLRVIQNAVVSTLSYNDKVQLIIPGKSNPQWTDLKAALVRATFFGKTLTKVERK